MWSSCPNDSPITSDYQRLFSHRRGRSSRYDTYHGHGDRRAIKKQGYLADFSTDTEEDLEHRIQTERTSRSSPIAQMVMEVNRILNHIKTLK